MRRFESLVSSILSTPHGALGTMGVRNLTKDFYGLSTPHGALGTQL